MHNPEQQSFKHIIRAIGVFIGVTVMQVTLAASGDSAVFLGTPASNDEPMATTLTGQQVYNNVCIACHSPPGVGGAPALGDAEAWTGRIAQGMDTLIDHALNGFSGSTGVMPKKGERVDLSDEEIIGAVKYMVDQVAQ